jgi:hypothetical protein
VAFLLARSLAADWVEHRLGRRAHEIKAGVERGKRHRFMCYDSVAARCSCQSGTIKEGSRWDTSHKPH